MQANLCSVYVVKPFVTARDNTVRNAGAEDTRFRTHAQTMQSCVLAARDKQLTAPRRVCLVLVPPTTASNNRT